MTTETELKLTIFPNQVTEFKRLLTAQASNLSAPSTEHLVSIYYDTPELMLAQRDLTLRLREVDGQWVQTLKKGEQASGSAYQRLELETTVAGPALDIGAIDDKRIRALLSKPAVMSALAPVFKTDIRRTRWTLKDELGNTIEVALDQGKITAGGQSLKINEVELELLEGNAGVLFERALDWATTISLIPELMSKAARGYQLHQNEALAPPVTAKLPELGPEMSPQQALIVIVKETLRHFHANVRGVFNTDEMDYVHQARVALRRLRSAEKAFSSLGLDACWDDITKDLRWLAAELGNVRDLDVLLESTLPPIEAAFGKGLDFTPLRDAAAEWRTQCRTQVRAALRSPRFGKLIITLLQWIELQEIAEGESGSTLPPFAKRTLNKSQRQVNRPMGKWDELDEESRHDLRKKAKKLRYALEFFSPLYKQKDMKRYLRELKGFQEILGEMNDAVATRMKMAELVERNPAVAYEAGIIVGWATCQANEGEAHIKKAISELQSASLP